MVECHLQIHKTQVDWFGKLPRTLEDPAEGLELVHCFTFRTKTTFLLLNPRINYAVDRPLQYPLIDLAREAERFDPPIDRNKSSGPSS